MAVDADEIDALAATPALLAKAHALALGTWLDPQRSDRAAWSELRSGSGRVLRVFARFSPPGARCSCGRGDPCEHGLALLLLVASRREALRRGEEPAALREWLEPAKPRARRESPKDPEASTRATERRAAIRLVRMTAGLEQLDAWLDEVARRGVARLEPGGRALEAQAKRLVDAQLPGLATRLRAGVAAMASGGGWTDAVIELLGLAALASRAFRREAELEPGLRQDVRAVVGLPTREADVLARGERARDVFWVLGSRVVADERLTTRRTWLLGRSGRHALLLDFAPGDGFLRGGLPEGARVGAALVFHPSASPARALLTSEPSRVAPGGPPPAEAVGELLERTASTLAKNPFTARMATVLEAIPGAARGAHPSGGPDLRLATTDGALPVTHGAWHRLRGLSGGTPLRVACEWDGRALALLGCWAGGSYHSLAGPRVAPEPVRSPSPLRSALLAGAPSGTSLDRVAPRPLLEVLGAPTGSGAELFALVGARAAMERAGHVAEPTPAVAVEPCPPDARAAPPPPAGALLEELLSSGPAECLAEALTLLLRRGLVVPAEALPAALSTRDAALRARLRPVLGERGRWLASDEPAWTWARAELPSDDISRPHRRVLRLRGDDFESASSEDRLELVRCARAERRDVARAWIEELLRTEPPERRRVAVEALSFGLGPDDEPLLTRARGDRSPAVRAAAVEVLSRVFSSAFARAARERAERYVPAHDGSLQVRLPGPAFDARWAEAGLREEPPAHAKSWGKRLFWLAQLLAGAPPSHLAARLGSTPEAAVALAHASPSRAALLEGLARGALRFRERDFFLPLVRAHAAEAWEPALVPELLCTLIPRLAEPARTAETLALLARDGATPGLLATLARLPRPFGAELADRLLLELQKEGAPHELFPLVASGLPVSRLGVRLLGEGGAPRSSLERARARFDAIATLRGRIVSLLRRPEG